MKYIWGLLSLVSSVAFAQNNALLNNADFNNADPLQNGNPAANAPANNLPANNLPANQLNNRSGNNFTTSTNNLNNYSLNGPKNNFNNQPKTNNIPQNMQNPYSGNNLGNNGFAQNYQKNQNIVNPSNNLGNKANKNNVYTVPPENSNLFMNTTSNLPDPERNHFEDDAAAKVQKELQVDLDKYCGEYCSILSVKGRAKEVFNTTQADLGFENTNTVAKGTRKFRMQRVEATILIDTRFGSANVERLEKLLNEISKKYSYPTSLTWNKVLFPDSQNIAKSEAETRNDFATQVRNQLDRVISSYCPNDCKVHEVDVVIARAGVDELQNGVASRYLFTRDGRGALFVKGVNARLSLNSELTSQQKQKIEALLKETLSAYGTVDLSIKEHPFPKAASEAEKDADAARNDPFGINKFEQMLKLFKDYASVKEIYKETGTSKITEKESSESSKDKEGVFSSANSFWSQENLLLLGGIALLLLIVSSLGLRYVLNGKKAQAARKRPQQKQRFGQQLPFMQQQTDQAPKPQQTAEKKDDSELFKRLEVDQLREELIKIFMLQPKVARDVFTRLLREEGIEQCAKYVVIFGEIVVFELLSNSDLKNDITTLAEYVHVNLPSLSLEDQLGILKNLKLRMTAGKMKLMASKSLEVFDFIKGKSPRQIFELIADETAKCQAIVLTQIATDKRRSVFEFFEGNEKVDLLKELSAGDMISREYLINVAEALKRKALSKPSFDGENVRGTDVLMDLMERAELQEQRDLMNELDHTNPEAAKLLRSRLITVETLAFLRDGLLIEIFLSMEPNVMATFLAGTRDHIRSLIFSKAPDDVAANWAESLQSVQVADIEAYKLSEMQVLTKIRNFATQGLVNLGEINMILYPRDANIEGLDAGVRPTRAFKISNPLVA